MAQKVLRHSLAPPNNVNSMSANVNKTTKKKVKKHSKFKLETFKDNR